MKKCQCNYNNCCCNPREKEKVNDVKQNLLNDNILNKYANDLKIISDFTRLKILYTIKDEQLCVCDIAHILGLTKSAASHQLKLLRNNNLVINNKKGRLVYYQINPNIKNIFNLINKIGELNENNN